MKKQILVLALTVLVTSPGLAAEQETLFKGGEPHEHGGFGGPVIKVTSINSEPGLLVGGRGGWIIDQKFVLGLGGYGLVTGNLETEDNERVGFGYGGLELEYIAWSSKLVHLSAYTLLGAGGIGASRENDDGEEEVEGTGFFIAEPILNIELNITKFFRVALGAGYRFAVGGEAFDYEGMDISGVTGGLTFKFGKF